MNNYFSRGYGYDFLNPDGSITSYLFNSDYFLDGILISRKEYACKENFPKHVEALAARIPDEQTALHEALWPSIVEACNGKCQLDREQLRDRLGANQTLVQLASLMVKKLNKPNQ